MTYALHVSPLGETRFIRNDGAVSLWLSRGDFLPYEYEDSPKELSDAELHNIASSLEYFD